MSKNIYCPMIHNGLNINLKSFQSELYFNQCCLSTTQLQMPQEVKLLWQDDNLKSIREINNQNIWLDGCWQCQRLEESGIKSFRQSMIEGLGTEKNLSGPVRIDLLFDRSCNLACRTCSPDSSTFWEKHLSENNLPVAKYATGSNIETIKEILSNLDLSNLKQVQFCGGETLLGNTYWKTAELLAELIPNAKDNVLLGFQTNATQPIDEKYYKIIEKFNLVKLMVSIDGTHDKFEYLRWPANWNQVVDNISAIQENAPGNMMFYVQETVSNLSMLYFGEVSNWVEKNFNANKFGDPTEHSTQLAKHGYLDVSTITNEYFTAIKNTKMAKFIPDHWQENPRRIQEFIRETEKFDKIRGQDWKKTFPEVANFYSRYFK